MSSKSREKLENGSSRLLACSLLYVFTSSTGLCAYGAESTPTRPAEPFHVDATTFSKSWIIDLPREVKETVTMDMVQSLSDIKAQSVHGLIELSTGSAVRLESTPQSLFIWNYGSYKDCRVMYHDKSVSIPSGHVVILTRGSDVAPNILDSKDRRYRLLTETHLDSIYRAIDAEFDTSKHPLIVYDNKDQATRSVLKQLDEQKNLCSEIWHSDSKKSFLLIGDELKKITLDREATIFMVQRTGPETLLTSYGKVELCKSSAASIRSDTQGIMVCNFYSPSDLKLETSDNSIRIKSGTLAFLTSSKEKSADLLRSRNIRFRNLRVIALNGTQTLATAEFDTSSEGSAVCHGKDHQTQHVLENITRQQARRDRDWLKKNKIVPGEGWSQSHGWEG